MFLFLNRTKKELSMLSKDAQFIEESFVENLNLEIGTVCNLYSEF